MNVQTLERPAIQSVSPGSLKIHPESTTHTTIPNSSVVIHMVPKMPARKSTIGFGRSQYDCTDAVFAHVQKMGGRWTYMNSKWFPSRGRTAENEKLLVDAGLVAITSERSSRIMLAMRSELVKMQ
jgi:hypothetical protein